MHQELTSLCAILAALVFGAISPGPSFVMIARMAVASSRLDALRGALGMGVGGLLFGGAALMGLQSLFYAVPMLYGALKFLGGAYLCYLGFIIFKAAKLPLQTITVSGSNSRRSFWLGLTTQISNPKTAIVYASVFAAFLPQHFSVGFAVLLLAVVFLVETGWYSLVALLLSSDGPHKAYLSCKVWLDRAVGLVMFGLGLRLATSVLQPFESGASKLFVQSD